VWPPASRGSSRCSVYIESQRAKAENARVDIDAALRLPVRFARLKTEHRDEHATLAGHTMQHELETALAADALGSIDANRGMN